MKTLETDYLVVGCGAAGMAFADALIEASRMPTSSSSTVVTRQAGTGSRPIRSCGCTSRRSYYGVNSLPLGSEAIDRHGPNAGMYERASAAEICGYYDRVMQQRLLPSGRVRYFPMSKLRRRPPVRLEHVRR